MKLYRTPDARFEGLPDFAFAPNWFTLASGIRVHYLDEGPKDGPVVLLMHGEPSWCYLWRHMIPLLVAGGCRVLAPDLVGFGRSDKPVGKRSYSYSGQVAWMREWIEGLGLSGMVLGCQDWGSLIGLRLVAEMPERFAGVVLSNGGLPEGQEPPKAFALWRAFARFSPVFPIGKIVASGTRRTLSPAEVAAYDAPFPTRASKAGPRAYPPLVPFAGNVEVPAQKRAWASLEAFDKPFLCAFSDRDPITRGGDALFLGRVPGTAGQAHRTLSGGHFIQEDDPAGFAGALLEIAGKA